MTARASAAPICLNLALQGGGSHGAFTWGVLDALLEDQGFCFPGISGTSAGAMNAAAVVHGFSSAALEFPKHSERRHAEGCARAREALQALWNGVGTMGSLMWGVPAAQSMLMGMVTQWLSPYQTNPLDFNPLRNQLQQVVDFEAVQRAVGLEGVPKAFVCATNVRTGRGKIFKGAEISADAVMASACLPQLFRAVEIDGEHYWDGGYSGNPALYPLIYETQCSDMLLVQINPIEYNELPNTAADIMERMNEVTFNAGLLSELRAIDFVRRLLAEGRLDANRYKSVLLHRIDGGAALAEFGASSKTRADGSFLRKLFALGRAEGERWIADHRGDVGVRQTLQIVDNS
ncbi:MAG: patatin-like phospholipase family protein [Acidovorax sp.]|jgi:NTE family protein|nr:patatin-like phospholipase family protein [Acidovorax sp.]MDR3004408.1 patatin-like phospholipase family protein [Acidovorax sp.]